jgi:hypothetical protein
MTEADFAAEFQTDPFEALRTLRAFVEFGLVTKVDATKWLFPLILSSTLSIHAASHRVSVKRFSREQGISTISAFAGDM